LGNSSMNWLRERSYLKTRLKLRRCSPRCTAAAEAQEAAFEMVRSIRPCITLR